MSILSYEEKSFEIIKNSIKSAVFIDEKARDFFQKDSDLLGENEEEITVDLFNQFKEEGISLAIHKYKINDQKNEALTNYLFEDRDLVLLDWNLDGENSGQEYSLELLADIINRPHIHFCTIYTSEKGSDIDNVFRNIISYFSNETLENYIEKKESLEIEEEITKIKASLDDINLNRDTEEVKVKIGELFKTNPKEIKLIKSITGIASNKEAIIYASIALDNNSIKSEILYPSPTLISFINKTVIIDNTIITILNKQENEPKILIENISKNITASKSSFTQLLGLEMQSIFSKSSAFIDENLLNFTKEAVIYHRENYKKEGISHFFPEFIKEIMVEKAKLNIRNQELTLLEDNFLDSLNENIKPEIDELLSMNTFYNASKLHTDNKLNFGDVFKTEGVEEYYICITALCDCLRPDKINNTFFFAKGNIINKESALQLGDTAFLSYLSNKIVVAWTNVVSIEESLHKFSPVYIKPLSFTVSNNKFDENGNLSFSYINADNDISLINVNYITTIKANYTQRIANHAFSYPIRIGVDYVKSQPDEKTGKALWQDYKDKKINIDYPQKVGEFKELEKTLIESGEINEKHAVFKDEPETKELLIDEKKNVDKTVGNGS
jgi:hypothetical protein